MHTAHRISQKEKLKDKKKWAKQIMDDLVPESSIYTNFKDLKGDLSNYKLYNNILPQEELQDYCNPLGIDIGQYTQDIMPFNKTYSKIDVLLGEELKRGDNYRAILINEKGIDAKDKELISLYKAFVDEQIQASVAEAEAINQGMNPEEIEKLKQEIIVSKTPRELKHTTFLSSKEILANEILEFAKYDQNLIDKKNDGFKHATLSKKEVVWVGIRNGEIVIELINPLLTIYQKDSEEKWIQNGDYAGHKTRMSLTSILKEFGSDLEEEDVKKLEERLRGNSNFVLPTKEMQYHIENTISYRLASEHQNDLGETYDLESLGSYDSGRKERSGFYDEMFWVTHLEWVSQRKIIFATYIDEYGEEQEQQFDENFEIPADAKLIKREDEFGNSKKVYEWIDEFDNPMSAWVTWIPRVWEGTKIHGVDIYFNLREKPYQFTSIENPLKCKLGYHGLIYNNMNAEAISLMDRMKPFQFLYFIAANELQNLIVKNKGVLTGLDTSMIDSNLGKKDQKDPLEMTMFYINNGEYIYNSMTNAEGLPVNVARPMPQMLNGDNTAGILNLIQVLNFLDEQIGESCGVSKNREGASSPREAVTNVKQNLIQSSHITEPYFFKHNKLWEDVMNSYIIAASQLWKNKSIKKQYILSDGSNQLLNLPESFFDNSTFGVFVTNSGAEKDYFDDMRQTILPALQNNSSLSEISDILRAIHSGTSPEKVSQLIKIAEEKRAEQEQAMKEAEGEQMKELENKRIESAKLLNQFELEKIAAKGEEDRKTLRLQMELESLIPEEIPVIEDNTLDKEKFELDKNLKTREQIRKEIKDRQDYQIKQEDLKIKKQIKNRPVSK